MIVQIPPLLQPDRQLQGAPLLVPDVKGSGGYQGRWQAR